MSLRKRAVLPILLGLILQLLPAEAAARTVLPDRQIIIDWPSRFDSVPRISTTPQPAPIARVRLVTVEIILLPSRRIVVSVRAGRPAGPPHKSGMASEPVILPLPSALPLFVAALAGLLVVARRRRSGAALAGPHEAT